MILGNGNMNMTVKAFFVALLGVAVLHVSAGTLYWQIGASEAAKFSDGTFAVLHMTTDGGETSTLVESFSYYDGTVSTDSRVVVGSIAFAGADAPVEKLAQSYVDDSWTGKSFFVELVNSASENAVARSEIWDYSSISGFVDHSGLAIDDLIKASQIWNPGAFTAVPEPTSGLLFLIGGALLGLRRKKRA